MLADDSVVISPPAWGWPGDRDSTTGDGVDFPTCVGMARLVINQTPTRCGFPHLRGDGPRNLGDSRYNNGISPPAWGWPASKFSRRAEHGDFPTCVGMARKYAIDCTKNP